MQGTTLRKYGVQATINFELFEIDGIDFRIDAVHAAGDSVIMKDEGAEASTANGFTDEGKGYSLVLSATEMQAARIVIYLSDLTATKVWLDKAIVIETYGHASAMHAFDFDTATQNVNVASQDNIDFGALQKASITTAVPTPAENRTEMDANSTGLAAIFSGTDTIIPALIAALNDLSAAQVKTQADAALTDYDPSTRAENVADASAIITEVNANETKIDALFTNALTESYAADGAPASPAELLYMIWSLLSSLKFVTTVGTSRKLDGTSSAMTFAIDDPDSPTDINRSS
jgi:hypothetical protein